MHQALGHPGLNNYITLGLTERYNKETRHQRYWFEESIRTSLVKPSTAASSTLSSALSFGSQTHRERHVKKTGREQKYNLSKLSKTKEGDTNPLLERSTLWQHSTSHLVDAAEIGWGVPVGNNAVSCSFSPTRTGPMSSFVGMSQDEILLDRSPKKYEKRTVTNDFYDGGRFGFSTTSQQSPPKYQQLRYSSLLQEELDKLKERRERRERKERMEKLEKISVSAFTQHTSDKDQKEKRRDKKEHKRRKEHSDSLKEHSTSSPSSDGTKQKHKYRKHKLPYDLSSLAATETTERSVRTDTKNSDIKK